MPFRIKPGSSTDALVIDGSKVGVGTAEPTSLHVKTGEPTLRLDADGSQVWDVASVALRDGNELLGIHRHGPVDFRFRGNKSSV